MSEPKQKDLKKFLLKSGLPFEYEVKECLIKHGCSVRDEYSYLKEDENNIQKEFSYDFDASLEFDSENYAEFLVECKYKTEPTKWFFIPDTDSFVNKNSFFNPMDFFSTQKFVFSDVPYHRVIENPLGPFCLKGVEILNDKFVEVNITKAISQLAYGFIEKVIEAINMQINLEYYSESIITLIPIIITNADLHILNRNITTKEIENAESIENISSKHNFLLFNHKIGRHLKEYNYTKLNQFFTQELIWKIKKKYDLDIDEINQYIHDIASICSPETIVIMHHNEKHENYNEIFDYVKYLLGGSDALEKRMKEVKLEWEERKKKIRIKKL